VNRPQHRFCGRCGERLDLPPEGAPIEGGNRGTRPFAVSREEFSGSLPYREAPNGDDIPIFGIERESAWQSYRPYVGLVLAVIVVTLAYVAWRGSTTWAGSSALPAQAPSAATDSGTSGTTPSASQKSEKSPSAVPSPPVSTPVKPAELQLQPKSAPPVEDSANASPNTPSQAPTQGPAEPAPTRGVGGEELAAARDFMNGTNGRQQNLSEAAQWLWRSVRKQNLEATLLLSGLYLRGEGVPKNCEQARLLLDAAAVKGSKDAAERLRNLRAFGCE